MSESREQYVHVTCARRLEKQRLKLNDWHKKNLKIRQFAENQFMSGFTILKREECQPKSDEHPEEMINQ